MCLYPRTIRNPKYKPNKKNQGTIPNCRDERLLWINIPCETLEAKVEKLVSRKEPLDEGSTPLIYTPRYEGIRGVLFFLS